MKQISKAVLLLIVTLFTMAVCSSGRVNDVNENELVFKEEKPPFELKHYNEIPNHLVLIYDGGAHRNIQWNSNHLAPYISANIDGDEQWLFDGFLFLEIKDGNGRGFASGYEKQAARKIEWENLLKHYFSEGNAVHALNEQVGKIREEGKTDNFSKRKVVLSLPEPIPSQIDWGELNGKKLIFNNKVDRLEACKWYVNYAEELFESANFKNVELVGFYWLAEEATNSRDLAWDVADYVYNKKYDFYWIPYFASDGYSEWQKLGFNSVYYQPNYFFNETIPLERLQITVDRAKKHQMSLEIEFDERALKNNQDWGYRLRDYLDVYERNGVFDSLKVAYYQGNDAFYRLSKSNEESDVELYNRMVKIMTTPKTKH